MNVLFHTLISHADPAQVSGLARFFKTGPGQYGEGDKFLGIKIVTHNYSSLRYYYSVRNHIWLIRSGYSPASRSFRLFGRYVIKTFIRALFFETDRKDKVSAVFRGIRDGYSNAQRNEWRRC